jgi:hypothetical protein
VITTGKSLLTTKTRKNLVFSRPKGISAAHELHKCYTREESGFDGDPACTAAAVLKVKNS